MGQSCLPAAESLALTSEEMGRTLTLNVVIELIDKKELGRDTPKKLGNYRLFAEPGVTPSHFLIGRA